MQLGHLQQHWDAFGKEDPLFGILTWPDKKGGKWETSEFFDTGRGDVAHLLGKARELKPGISLARALDFGCGVGRLTQNLAVEFETVVGVDIAPSMIAHANTYNRFGDRCTYAVNDRPDLSLFADEEFDFILTLIVLQHMKPSYAEGYIREFLRALKPDGVLVFQLPAVSLTPEGVPVTEDWTEPVAEMYGMAESDVVRFLESNGARVLGTVAPEVEGPEKSRTYFVEKVSEPVPGDHRH